MQCSIWINFLYLLFHCTDAFWYPKGENQLTFNSECECGQKNIRLDPRIYGGQEVIENEYPWMASVISVQRSRVTCGASIINDRYVITAAHCLTDGKADMKIGVGAHSSCNWDWSTSVFSIENVFPHPSYDEQDPKVTADIMLVKLVMRISFNYFVQPICLPEIGVDVATRFGGESVSTLGWGWKQMDAVRTCGLQYVDLTLYNRTECAPPVSTVVCAGYKTAERGPCLGDSGGPLQIINEKSKYVLLGITSTAKECGRVDIPSMFTDVTQMLPWILQVTRHDSTYCSR